MKDQVKVLYFVVAKPFTLKYKSNIIKRQQKYNGSEVVLKRIERKIDS